MSLRRLLFQNAISSGCFRCLNNNKIQQVIKLDNVQKSNVEIKDHTTSYGWSYTYETGWLSVSNKITGVTALSLRIYDSQNSTWLDYTYTTKRCK